MNANLETAIRNEVLTAIPAKYLSTEERLELEQLDLRKLLSVFFIWRNRFITPRARIVHLSTELSAKNLPEIKGLVERIEILDPFSGDPVAEVTVTLPADDDLVDDFGRVSADFEHATDKVRSAKQLQLAL